MKLLLTLLSILSITVIFSCKGDNNASTTNTTPANTNNLTTPSPTAGVEHYTCPNGHIGSGGATAGTCSECGAILEHNSAFHNTPQPNDLSNNADPSATTPTVNSGVEHYICPDGHVGKGGPAAGTCSECGATLEHNAAYHNSPPPTDQAATTDPASNPNINSSVEHYICPSGHVGSGGAAAGTCSECGATLEHNAAYHNDAPPPELVESVNAQFPPATGTDPVATTPTTPTVEHYTCPNGHVGSGGPGEGLCSQCSAALVHNDAFHATDVINTIPNINSPSAPAQPTIIPQPSEAVSPVFRQNPGSAPTNFPPVTTTSAEPAQNARGVWHYTCSNGCVGGAGSAVACSVCGATLAHNTLYHN